MSMNRMKMTYHWIEEISVLLSRSLFLLASNACSIEAMARCCVDRAAPA